MKSLKKNKYTVDFTENILSDNSLTLVFRLLEEANNFQELSNSLLYVIKKIVPSSNVSLYYIAEGEKFILNENGIMSTTVNDSEKIFLLIANFIKHAASPNQVLSAPSKNENGNNHISLFPIQISPTLNAALEIRETEILEIGTMDKIQSIIMYFILQGKILQIKNKKLARDDYNGNSVTNETDETLKVNTKKEDQDFFFQLIETIHDWIIETDPYGIITFSNNRAKDFLGYRKEKIIGTSMLEYIHESQRESVFNEIMNKLPHSGELKIDKIIFKNKYGDSVFADTSITPFFDDSGQLKGLRGVHRNISDRLKNEELSNHYKLLSEHSKINIIFYDQETGQITEANDAAQKTYGYSKDEFLSLNVTDIRDRTQAQGIASLFEKAKNESISFQTFHKKKNNQIFPVEVTAQPTIYMGRKLIISLTTDITNRVNSENEMKRINRSLFIISECNKTLVRAENEPALLKNIINQLSSFSGYKSGLIALVDNKSRLNPKAWFGFDKEDFIRESFNLNNHEFDRFAIVRSTKERKIIIEKDKNNFEFADETASTGSLTGIALPLINEEFIFGALTLYSDKTEEFSSEEIKLLSELTNNISYGIAALHKRDELKIIETNSRKSEMLLRSVLDNLPIGVIFTDKDGNFIYENPEAVKIWGKKCLVGPSEYYLYHCKNAQTGEEIKPDDWSINHALKYKSNCIDEFLEIQTFDNKIKFIQNSAVPFFDSKKTVMGGIILIRDITSSRNMETALKNSEIEYISLLEGISDIVLKLDKELNIIFYNITFEKKFGYKKEEILNKNLLQFIYSNNINLLKTNIKLICEGDTIPPFEMELITKNSNKLLFELSLGLLKNSEGIVVGFHCVARDINERKKLENQLLQSQKMEAIGRLAGGIAHDFNNILTIIFGYSDFLRTKAENLPEISSDLQQIFMAGKRASALTQQLLAFSRREIIELKSLNINEVIVELQKMLGRLIGEDISIKFNLDSNLKRVKADIGQVDQIIMNLVVNARDAMPDGGDIIISTSNASRDEFSEKEETNKNISDYILISIQDTGTGIKEENLPYIFEPFFTTKSKGKGTGLGLSVVYGIVKQYNGEILINSIVGKGTTFKIYIPAFEDSSHLKTTEKSHTDLKGKGEIILLVEDDDEISKLVFDALRMNNYMVLGAHTLKTALDIYAKQSGRIDLVFSDVVLPDGNGVDLIEMLKAINPNLKILLASGYADEKSKWSIIQTKNYNFLSKPFDIRSMFAKIRSIFDNN